MDQSWCSILLSGVEEVNRGTKGAEEDDRTGVDEGLAMVSIEPSETVRPRLPAIDSQSESCEDNDVVSAKKTFRAQSISGQ